MFNEFIRRLETRGLISTNIAKFAYGLTMQSQEEVITVLDKSNDRDIIITLCQVFSKVAFISNDFNTEAIADSISRLLTSSDDVIRLEATIAIGYLDAHYLLDTLIDLFHDEKKDYIKIMIINSIARWRMRESTLPLIDIASSNLQSLEVRVNAIEALGQTQSNKSLPLLLSLLKHNNAKIRSASILAINNLKTSETLSHLEVSEAVNHLGQLLNDHTEVYSGVTIGQEARETISYLRDLA